MSTTLGELKKDRPDLVEAVRTEEKDKLHKDSEKTKKELKEAKEAKEKLEKELKEAKEKFEKELKETKEGKVDKGGKEAKETKEKFEAMEKKVKDLGEQVVNLEAEKTLRESKEVYLKKIKDSGLTEKMIEGLEEQCLGKKSEEMDEKIKARIEFVQKISKVETIGIVPKKEKKKDPEKEKAELDEDIKDAF